MDHENRIFLVRASCIVPAAGLALRTDNTGDRETSGELIAAGLREIVREELEANALTVRTAMCVEITNAVNLGAVEPTDPSDVHTHVLPSPENLAAVMAKVRMLPRPASHEWTFEDVHALVGEVERWKARCAARLDSPEGREIFAVACNEMLAGTLGGLRGRA